MADSIAGTNSALHRDVANKIRAHGNAVSKIYRVLSAGDSGTGDTTVLFVDFGLKPKTAFLGCEAVVKAGANEAEDEVSYKTVCVVVDGWDLP